MTLNPTGECWCGCGQITSLARQTHTRLGVLKGEHHRFCHGHRIKVFPVEYIEQDCGYETPCWVWQLGKSEGYGRMFHAGGTKYAHRVYYERFIGPIPDGKQLDHLCRNRACVNPAHLEPVTNTINSRRGLRTKLTAEAVVAIKEQLARGDKQRHIAEQFGVAARTICNINRGITWTDIRSTRQGELT